MSDVEIFAQQHSLTEHTALLRKGALIAQNPNSWRDIGGSEALTERERAVLEREATHRWAMPKKLILTIATCSIGAAVQGWDQTGTNGANIFFPEYYGIAEKTTRNELILGIVNAAPYLGSA